MHLIPAFVLLFALLVADGARAQGDLIEYTGFLNVTIRGKFVRLEALTVRRAETTGRLPIALIAHAKPTTQAQMGDHHVQNYVNQARDLARRGWLAVIVMRRGFGASDGPQPVPVSCASTSLLERFDADADDLAATLSAIAQRSYAEITRSAFCPTSPLCFPGGSLTRCHRFVNSKVFEWRPRSVLMGPGAASPVFGCTPGMTVSSGRCWSSACVRRSLRAAATPSW